MHRVVFVDFKNHLFRADLGFFALHIQPRRGFGGSNSRNSKACTQFKDRSERAARAPLHSDRRRVRVHTCTCSASMPCTYVYAYAQSCLCTCTHAGPRVEAARRHGKAFDNFCMRRNRGSVVLLPTTILALETARGLGR